MMIATLEGFHHVNVGDWIIRGVQGEFYPCKSDIFEATYERVADDERTDSVSEVATPLLVVDVLPLRLADTTGGNTMTEPSRRFRKKPVVIEAMQFAGTPAESITAYRWVEANTLGSFEPMAVIEGRVPCPASGASIDPRDGRMMIATLEGFHHVNVGDWIIRGVQGEFYPCKSDIFEATYERVADDERTDSVSEVRGDEAP